MSAKEWSLLFIVISSAEDGGIKRIEDSSFSFPSSSIVMSHVVVRNEEDDLSFPLPSLLPVTCCYFSLSLCPILLLLLTVCRLLVDPIDICD